MTMQIGSIVFDIRFKFRPELRLYLRLSWFSSAPSGLMTHYYLEIGHTGDSLPIPKDDTHHRLSCATLFISVATNVLINIVLTT
jgi:hypothetical protein